jgi:hypothetical protein
MTLETSAHFFKLTPLITREDFINKNHPKSFKSCKLNATVIFNSIREAKSSNVHAVFECLNIGCVESNSISFHDPDVSFVGAAIPSGKSSFQ